MKYLALEIWVYFLGVCTGSYIFINGEQILANSLISHAYALVIWNNVFVWTKVSYLLESLMTICKLWCSNISPIFEKCSFTFLSRGLVSFFIFIEWKRNTVWNSLGLFQPFSFVLLNTQILLPLKIKKLS